MIIQVSVSKLRDMVLEIQPQNFMAFLDLFAIGCFLHSQGHKRAGRKAVDQVLSAVSGSRNKAYLSSIMANLEGNERAFADEIHAQLEINELWRDK